MMTTIPLTYCETIRTLTAEQCANILLGLRRAPPAWTRREIARNLRGLWVHQHPLFLVWAQREFRSLLFRGIAAANPVKPLREMVNSTEVWAYRGLRSPHPGHGLSWTLRPDVAYRFATADAEPGAAVLRRRVRVSDIVFWNNYGGEAEIITAPKLGSVEIWSTPIPQDEIKGRTTNENI